ncbi:MAG: hypothetical protein ACREUT_11100 [Steroidobacteraceae bacterium]
MSSNSTGSTPLDHPGMTHTSRCALHGSAPRRVLACAGIALAAFLVAGCHGSILRGNTCNKPQPYASAQSIPPLRVPSGIDAPDTHAALAIPALNEPAPPPRSLREPCLDAPPPFATPGPAAPGPAGRRVPST